MKHGILWSYAGQSCISQVQGAGLSSILLGAHITLLKGLIIYCLLPHRLLTRTNSDLHTRTFPRLARAFTQYLIKSRSNKKSKLFQKQHMSKSETSQQEEMNSSGSNIIVG